MPSDPSSGCPTSLLNDLFKQTPAFQKYQDSFLFPHWEDYAQSLAAQGFARGTLRHVLYANFRFYSFLKHLPLKHLNDIAYRHYQGFLSQCARDFSGRYRRTAPRNYIGKFKLHVGRFLEYTFKKAGLVFAPARTTALKKVIPEELLENYEQFCRLHQGVRESTLKDYRWWLLRLERFLDKKRKTARIEDVVLTDLDAFIGAQAARELNRRSLQHLIGVLRSFFKYLFSQGIIFVNLADRLVYPRVFQGELRPKYIPWSDVQNILANINQKTTGGQRDYTVLVLLASYGLRGREIVSLKLEDIDWQGKRLVLRQRKGGRMAVFPLTREVELALKNYIERGRLQSGYPEVFMTTKAPMRPMTSGALSGVVQKRLRQSGLQLPSYGSYLLRHSFAKTLLDRGADLFTIKQLLGHQYLQTTLIYTRIAISELREVADNYARLL